MLDARAGPNHVTALHFAARNGHVAAVQLLLAAGANVNAANAQGHTALHQSAQTGSVAVLKLLLDAGAAVCATSSGGSMPLHTAAQMGAAEYVPLLIAAGADVNAANNRGRTALHHATMCGQAAVLEQLLRHGAAVDAADSSGRTPLLLACEHSLGNQVAVVQQLLQAGADVHVATAEPRVTCLSAAVNSGQEAVVRVLLEVPGLTTDDMRHAVEGAVAVDGDRAGAVAMVLRALTARDTAAATAAAARAMNVGPGGEQLLAKLVDVLGAEMAANGNFEAQRTALQHLALGVAGAFKQLQQERAARGVTRAAAAAAAPVDAAAAPVAAQPSTAVDTKPAAASTAVGPVPIRLLAAAVCSDPVTSIADSVSNE